MVYRARPTKQNLLTIAATVVISAAQFLGGSSVANAAVIDLKFTPPQIEAQKICVTSSSSADTIAKWKNWDGERLPDVPTATITLDMTRLMEIGGVEWLPTIQKVIDRLAEVDPQFAGYNAMVLRISALEAAGAFEELSRQQLVAQLASNVDKLSPRLKNALSGYYRDGIGVARDVPFANALLIEAAYAGNADALLTLTKMELAGEGVEGWDLPNDLAVTMAFGSLVGELNTSICDRASRIAREYLSGEIVARDPRLAQDWYRFSADLGDSNSAWKVVEFHLKAEGFDKDNDTLMKYLKQASDDGLWFAQIEMGRTLEVGSLVERDLDGALALYRSVAAKGYRQGLTRVAVFLETYADQYPDAEEERVAALEELAKTDSGSGWAFTRLAQHVYKTKGRWAGRDEAIVYLEEAAARGDLDGSVELAMALISKGDSPVDFERAVDILSYATSSLGGVTPAKRLEAAFMCSAPDSPRVAEARYWSDIEDATATKSVDITPAQIFDRVVKMDPLVIAQIQSRALYGRPKATENYLQYLEVQDSESPEILAFWNEFSDYYPEVLSAVATLHQLLATDPEVQTLAIDLLREQYAESGGPAAMRLAEPFLDYANGVETGAADVRRLLEVSANAGNGTAVRLLAEMAPGEHGGQDVYTQFADVIDRNGDFEAIVFSIPYVTGEKRDVYLNRAKAIIPCDYKNVMNMSRLYHSIDSADGAAHWMQIAEDLIGGNAWAITDLARSKLDILGQGAAPQSLALFQQAAALGDMSAQAGIFELLIGPDLATYDPDGAAQMIRQSLDTQDTAVLIKYLSRYRSADPVVQAKLEPMVDMPQAFLVAADSGDISSMRSYAMYLRNAPDGAGSMKESTRWMTKAAEGGDVTAMAEVGYALAFGIGTEPDLEAGIKWLKQAADAGSDKAAAITALLNLKEGI